MSAISDYTTIHLGLDENIILSNAISRTKAYIDKKLLALLILKQPIPADIVAELKKLALIERDIDNNTQADIAHWYNRNWTNSLSYYLWSHTDHLFDQGENYKSNQSDAVLSYIKMDGLPTAPRVAAEEALSLENLAELPNDDLGTVLHRREAVPVTPIRSIDIKKVSSILWYGMQDFRHCHKLDVAENPLNAVNSFGIAFDVYLCIYSVPSLAPGIYFYDSIAHKIEPVKLMDVSILRAQMCKCQVDQRIAYTASFAILLAAHFERYQWRYRHEGALKQLYISCGQIVHPLMLLATIYKYKTHVSPAINDSLALDLVELDPKEFQIMYILSIG